jgi:hypothetical protein
MNEGSLGLDAILEMAQREWLNPALIEEILKDPFRFGFALNADRPVDPGNGSLYLYDKSVKHYKVDGIIWSKKPNGRLQETYSNIRVNGSDKLYGVYAAAETNRAFQKRIYRLLIPNYEYLLVHYRECEKYQKKQTRSKDASKWASSGKVVHPVIRSQAPLIEENDWSPDDMDLIADSSCFFDDDVLPDSTGVPIPDLGWDPISFPPKHADRLQLPSLYSTDSVTIGQRSSLPLCCSILDFSPEVDYEQGGSKFLLCLSENLPASVFSRCVQICFGTVLSDPVEILSLSALRCRVPAMSFFEGDSISVSVLVIVDGEFVLTTPCSQLFRYITARVPSYNIYNCAPVGSLGSCGTSVCDSLTKLPPQILHQLPFQPLQDYPALGIGGKFPPADETLRLPSRTPRLLGRGTSFDLASKVQGPSSSSSQTSQGFSGSSYGYVTNSSENSGPNSAANSGHEIESLTSLTVVNGDQGIYGYGGGLSRGSRPRSPTNSADDIDQANASAYERNSKIRVVQISGQTSRSGSIVGETSGSGQHRVDNSARPDWLDEDDGEDPDDDHIGPLSPSMMDDYLVTVVKQLVALASSDDELESEIHCLDANGFSLLHYCSMYGLSTSIPVLLTRGADINQQTSSHPYSTSLHLASRAGHVSAVSILLLHDADVSILDADGLTAYDTAVRAGKEDVCLCIQRVRSTGLAFLKTS